MTNAWLIERYNGIQTLLNEGCYFYSLMSVAEEYLGKPLDLLAELRAARMNHWITDDATVYDPCAILTHATSKQWSLRLADSVPSIVPDEMYTILKYYNPRTHFTHFRRRYMDTVVNSVTVREGKLSAVYLFTVGK